MFLLVKEFVLGVTWDYASTGNFMDINVWPIFSSYICRVLLCYSNINICDLQMSSEWRYVLCSLSEETFSVVLAMWEPRPSPRQSHWLQYFNLIILIHHPQKGLLLIQMTNWILTASLFTFVITCDVQYFPFCIFPFWHRWSNQWWKWG